jgi:serine-type D-Ala-D-Ala carboxypeptidase (penicillin-binding protein 5/6)
MFRKWIWIFLILILLPSAAWAEPVVEAAAAILINSRTAEVLWEKNAHAPMYPASITKVLTAVLLLENTLPDEVAVTSRTAAATRGSSLYLLPGQAITMDDLLYGLMLQSANDGAVVAAEHIAGSVDSFSAMMNIKAAQVGARHSNFTNPHGLPDEKHTTTAYDMAMITRYAMANPRFREVAFTRRYSMSWPGEADRILVNRIPLMKSYEGMLGVKSGYTAASRHTFAGAAERDGFELIVVVLGAGGNRLWQDTTALLDYGFSRYAPVRPVEEGDSFGPVTVRFGKPVMLQAVSGFEFTQREKMPEITYELELADDRVAPVRKGELLGEVVILADGRPMGRIPLAAAQDVERALLASGRFWLLSGMLTVTGLRFRKLRRRRKKRRLQKRDSALYHRTF